MQKTFSFKLKDREHEAIILANDFSVQPSFVFIHGAGVGTKERIHTFSEVLLEHNISMFAFDQSGAGKDAPQLSQSSLEARTDEAKFAIGEFAATGGLTICGSSMGGEIAIRMLEFFPVKNLILFCPGIYDERAFPVRFDQGFTDIIRQPESWRNSYTFSLLRAFTGNLLIVIGSEDTVIPSAVIQSLDQAAVQTNRKEVMWIPGCPHGYQGWLAEHPDMSHVVAQKVLEFSV